MEIMVELLPPSWSGGVGDVNIGVPALFPLFLTSMKKPRRPISAVELWIAGLQDMLAIMPRHKRDAHQSFPGWAGGM